MADKDKKGQGWTPFTDGHQEDQIDETPLCMAAAGGYVDVVQLLCEAGADKDKENQDGKTPLCMAAGNGSLDVVRFLCNAGADKDKQTPLSFAAGDGHLTVVQFLCETGVDRGEEVLRCLRECDARPLQKQRLA